MVGEEVNTATQDQLTLALRELVTVKDQNDKLRREIAELHARKQYIYYIRAVEVCQTVARCAEYNVGANACITALDLEIKRMRAVRPPYPCDMQTVRLVLEGQSFSDEDIKKLIIEINKHKK